MLAELDFRTRLGGAARNYCKENGGQTRAVGSFTRPNRRPSRIYAVAERACGDSISLSLILFSSHPLFELRESRSASLNFEEGAKFYDHTRSLPANLLSDVLQVSVPRYIRPTFSHFRATTVSATTHRAVLRRSFADRLICELSDSVRKRSRNRVFRGSTVNARRGLFSRRLSSAFSVTGGEYVLCTPTRADTRRQRTLHTHTCT